MDRPCSHVTQIRLQTRVVSPVSAKPVRNSQFANLIPAHCLQFIVREDRGEGVVPGRVWVIERLVVRLFLVVNSGIKSANLSWMLS
jgi:hypothetical protein